MLTDKQARRIRGAYYYQIFDVLTARSRFAVWLRAGCVKKAVFSTENGVFLEKKKKS